MMAPRDRDYLALQVEALFTHDAAGRIISTNEPTPQPAPRFFLGRSRDGAVWRVRHDLPGTTARRLEALAASAAGGDQSDLRARPAILPALLATLGTDEEHATITAGPAYHFPDAAPTLSLPEAEVRRLTRADIRLLAEFGWASEELLQTFEGWEPMLALFVEGAVASLAFSSRNTPRAAECGVETHPAHRGRGYAPQVVAAWSRAVRASQRIPLYSTAWANTASQSVARMLGLIQYGSDLSIS